jgi:hypothetical protein
MSFFEYLPHEYSLACSLAYIYDLHPYDYTIFNMVSEQYPRDVDEDYASASDSEICEEDGSDDDEVLSVSSQNLESSTSQNSILFGSFANPIIPVSCTSIVPVFDGFSIKVGEISCFLGDSCSNNGDSAITSSEEDKKSKDDESQFVISKASKKPKNQSVQAFSSMIKRRHDDKVNRFSHDQNRKNGEKLSDSLLCSLGSTSDFSTTCLSCSDFVFDPGGTSSFRSSLFSSLVFAVAIYLSFLSMLQTQRLKSSHFVFDPGGISEIDCSLLLFFLDRCQKKKSAFFRIVFGKSCFGPKSLFHAFGYHNQFSGIAYGKSCLRFS